MATLREKTRDDVVVVHPYGYFTGGTETDDLQNRLFALSDAGTKLVVLNLADVQHLTSAGIGAVAAAKMHFDNAGGELRVCAINQRMSAIVIRLLVDIFKKVYETEDQAVMGF